MEVDGAVREQAVPATVDSGSIYVLTAQSLHVGIAAETASIRRARCAIHIQPHGFANKKGITRRGKLGIFGLHVAAGTTGAENASNVQKYDRRGIAR